MQFKTFASVIYIALLSLSVSAPAARADDDCRYDSPPAISFIEIQSVDILTAQPLVVKGKLKMPVTQGKQRKCGVAGQGRPAVVVLHGSAGIDARGDFYATALNARGIATLEIDMWEARGIVSLADRPPHPIFTYPDAFAALAYLSAYPGIDPARIGVMGFSWGGVIAMASATENYATSFGGPRRFKAHVAHYPVCYAYNHPFISNSDFGSNAGNPLTGAPILIQIGDQDGYDEGATRCAELKASLVADEQDLMTVVTYAGAHHAWDRLLVPAVFEDTFAHLGAGGTIQVKPHVVQAYQAQDKVVRFFLKNL